MRWRPGIAALLLLLAELARGAPDLMLINALVSDRSLSRPVDLVISGAVITAIEPAGERDRTRAVPMIDVAGARVVPGLADMHVHLERFEDPGVLDQFLAAGVTTVRSMNGGDQARRWRDEIRRGERVGPRILLTSPIIEGRDAYWDDSLRAGTARDARDLLPALDEGDYDFLKVYHTLPRAAFRALARDAELPVVGHVPGDIRLREAMQHMVSIEHFRGFGPALTRRNDLRSLPAFVVDLLGGPFDDRAVDRAIARAVATRTWLTPTLVQLEQVSPPKFLAERLAGADLAAVPPAIASSWDPVRWRPGTRELLARLERSDWRWWELARSNRCELLRRLADAGAGVLAGSDTPAPFLAPGRGLLDELHAMVRCGLGADQAFTIATASAGDFIAAHVRDAGAPSGRVAVGWRADLLVLGGDPGEAVRALDQLNGIVAAGRWIDGKTLRARELAARTRYQEQGQR